MLMLAYGIYFGEQVILLHVFLPHEGKNTSLGSIRRCATRDGLEQWRDSGWSAATSLILAGSDFRIYLPEGYSPYFAGRGGRGGTRQKKVRQSKLRLVVNNDEFNDQSKPKYWN